MNSNKCILKEVTGEVTSFLNDGWIYIGKVQEHNSWRAFLRHSNGSRMQVLFSLCSYAIIINGKVVKDVKQTEVRES